MSFGSVFYAFSTYLQVCGYVFLIEMTLQRWKQKKPLTDEELLELLMNSDDDEEVLDTDVLENQEDDEYNEHYNWENLSNPELEDENEAADLYEISNEDSDESSNDNSVNTDPPNKCSRLDAGLFNWKRTEFKPTIYDFDEQNSGCQTDNLGDNPSVLDIFESFITKSFLEQTVKETNAYYLFVASKNPTL